jgi:hypothetical protein
MPVRASKEIAVQRVAGAVRGPEPLRRAHVLPKGFTAPLHTDSKDLGGLVLAGSFGSGEEGTAEKLGGAGS